MHLRDKEGANVERQVDPGLALDAVEHARKTTATAVRVFTIFI
jgi:hypothetical protein